MIIVFGLIREDFTKLFTKVCVIDLMFAFYNGHCKDFKGEHHEKM